MSIEHTHPIEHRHDYRSDVDAILSKQLSAEIIDTYADDALDELVGLVQRVTDAYKHQPTVHFENSQDQEAAAFRYYGLGDVEDLLDHIANKADEIRHLDDVIARIPTIDSVITPPDPREVNIGGGDSIYTEKKHIPRLKTLLFILSNEFAVNVDDTDQLQMRKGILRDNTMREVSYHIVEARSISRTMLVCDEEGNATFVFNDNVLRESGISSDDLLGLTKTELKSLIEDEPILGQRLPYTKNFVPNVVTAITEPLAFRNIVTEEVSSEQGAYLHPLAPEQYLTIGGMSKMFDGLSPSAIRKAIDELSDQLGYVGKYKFGSNITWGYSPEQQQMIRQVLEERGALGERSPEGYLSATGLSKVLGVAEKTVSSVIANMADALGEAKLYKFGNVAVPGYSPEQQKLISQALEASGRFKPAPPEGYLAAKALAAKLGVSDNVVYEAIDSLGTTLGETDTYKFRTNTTTGYSPEQQNIIWRRLTEKGLFSNEAPGDYLTIRGMFKAFGVSQSAVEATVKQLGDELGPVDKYRFGNRIANGYSPHQQNMIRNHMMERGLFADPAPEGYLSVRGIAGKFDVGNELVTRAISELGKQLGEIKVWRFAQVAVPGYSPEQQDLIQRHLEADNVLVEQAPDGYRSFAALVGYLPHGAIKIQRAIDELGESLGEVRRYRFTTRLADGYSPEQQEMLRQYLSNKK